MSKGSIFGKKTMPSLTKASKHEHGSSFTDTHRSGGHKPTGHVPKAQRHSKNMDGGRKY